MTRYGFLLYHADVQQFLEALREKGLVDITLKEFTPSDELAAQMAQADDMSRIAREMHSIKLIDGDTSSSQNPCFATLDQAVETYHEAVSKINEYQTAIASANSQLAEVSIWGEFDPKAIDQLATRGLNLRFFETSNKAYQSSWEDELPIEVVSKNSTHTYFVVVENTSNPLIINLEALEVKAPSSSTSQVEQRIEELHHKVEQCRTTIARCASWREAITERSLELAEQIDFTRVEASANQAAEGTLKMLEGWSVNADREQIEAFAKNQAVIYTAEDAKAEQNPPIKLKNTFFARLYEPIGKLYLLPEYRELDMTPFFAPFFMIFFGMCFGDAGYGLLFIVAILALWKKIPAKFKDFAWLGIFLNLAAVVFGIFSGNVFGIALVKIEALAEFKQFFLDPNDIFYLSVAIGAVQILFGQTLRIFNRIRRGGSFAHGLSSIGWVLLFVSSIVAGFEFLGDVFSTQSTAYLIVAGLAAVLILFFNAPGKNPLVNFGGGLYSAYEMATGVIGDLISYVRLFAIGLAGGVIAQVFNELSRGLSGDIPVVSILVMIVILIIGHGLNIFISILGAFVHPVRLTFVEFYKNAEFGGGGREFKPFKRKINKQ